ncbi:hypothetical protein GCM10011519_16190 [Marmoricola endophyticus]|uniref:DUF7847 domain-containing protein n=1 Tax=Marmoricola endophyticus TaxID=2040280 RepID=A0A917BHN3_9ACTN|nr:hypothetical protein [Marmoricola endophyticus]GGF43072.1 hypothetical protein GCM10011519_16190 [Marmoricola endophyticus]
MSQEPPPPGDSVPGAGPVPAPGPAWGQGQDPTPPAWAVASSAGPAGMYGPGARPLHQPGTVPLRPLTLSDIFDAAFRTVRRNPKATIGMGALVGTAFLALPFVVTLVLGATGAFGTSSLADPYASDPFGDVASALSSVVSSLLSGLAGIVVAGLIVPVVTRAALGRRLTIGESWRLARGRLLALLGLTLLEALIAVVAVTVVALVAVGVIVGLDEPVLGVVLGLLLGLVALLGLLTVHVRWFQLAAPALVAERRGVLAAMARAGRLSRGSFWRLLGIWLLTGIVAGFVGNLLTVPLSVVGAIGAVAAPGSLGTTVLLVSGQLGSVLAGAVVGPFTGTVAVLQYLDQRFRKEGFDIELVAWAEGSDRDGSGRR